MPASTILVLSTPDDGATPIAPVLTTAGHTVTHLTDPAVAFAQVVGHQLAIIDLGPGTSASGTSGLELCREIRATPSMAAVPILCVASSDDVEERIGFLEAGADDVIARPFDSRELEARVEALLLRFQRSRELAPIVSTDGVTLTKARRTVAVYSPKGGVGTTTVAVNVAVAAAQQRPDKVVLVDLHLQFGSVVAHLNLEPTQTIADVLRDDTAMREAELLRTYTTRHDSGLHVLAAPPSPEVAELINPDHVGQLIATLLETFEAVVIDAGSTLDERVLTVFEAAETVILPVYPEISALKAVHSLLDYLKDTDAIGAKSTFVLNNMFAREILKPRDIEAALGTRITLDLPYDPFLYQKAVNEGVPIVIGAPRAPAAVQLTKLSATAFGLDSASAPAAAGRKGSRFGFGRRG